MSVRLAVGKDGWMIVDAGGPIVTSFREGGSTCVAISVDGAAEWLARPEEINQTFEAGISARYVLAASDKSISVSETIRYEGENLFSIERRWENHADQSIELVPVMEVTNADQPSFWLIPCVNYNGNASSNGQEPKGMLRNGRPWVYAYRRIGLPAATFSENDVWSVGLFTDLDDATSLTSSCSIVATNDGVRQRILWPEREEPLSYTFKDGYGGPRQESVNLEPGGHFEVICHLTIAPVGQRNFGWTRTYDIVHDRFPRTTVIQYAPEEVWTMAIDYASTVLFNEEMRLFDMGLLPDGDHSLTAAPGRRWEKRQTGRFEIGWCGQNAALATSMIHDYEVTGNRRSLEIGIDVLDTWSANACHENGLFRVHLDDKLAGRDGFVADTCNLGWGAWQFLLAWEKALKLGIEKPAWRALGINLCNFSVANGDATGRLGKLWSDAGCCLDWNGTIGAFMLLPLLQAYRITGDERYLNSTFRAYRYYVDTDLSRMCCTAGALDTNCIDREACWPLLRTALDLYEITSDMSYLDDAKLAAYYLLSWMMLYDAAYPPECDFVRCEYRTYGGMSVSTQHHQLDPYGALISREWLRLSRLTQETRWGEWARSTWANSLYGLSDGTLTVRGMLRPRGSQNEGFRHCHWGTWDGVGGHTGAYDDWLVSWPGAFRLIALMEENWESYRP